MACLLVIQGGEDLCTDFGLHLQGTPCYPGLGLWASDLGASDDQGFGFRDWARGCNFPKMSQFRTLRVSFEQFLLKALSPFGVLLKDLRHVSVQEVLKPLQGDIRVFNSLF